MGEQRFELLRRFVDFAYMLAAATAIPSPRRGDHHYHHQNSEVTLSEQISRKGIFLTNPANFTDPQT